MDRKQITIATEKQFTNLNDMITDFVKEQKGDGLVHIFVAHTTCGIKILEGELLLLGDISVFLDDMFPQDKKYMHDRIEIRDVPLDERVNGFSHMRQLFFSSDATVPVRDGKMMLGKWQTVFLVELDPFREREIVLTYMS
ncbi:MAG: secondary thiamine-phosphate synthase enzyme YjbQ [Eubacteriales bacterium]